MSVARKKFRECCGRQHAETLRVREWERESKTDKKLPLLLFALRSLLPLHNSNFTLSLSVCVFVFVCVASFLDVLLLLLLLLHAFVVGEGGQIRSVALAFLFFFFCTIFELNCRNFYLACLLYLSVEHVTSNWWPLLKQQRRMFV